MQKYKEPENNGLTVIIPTYIPKDYLWDCLDSIEKQSLDKDKFQVIIVLNGEKEPYWSKIIYIQLHFAILKSKGGITSKKYWN